MFNQDQKLRCRIYCRVSSEEQQEKETIENQVNYATKYCDLYEIDIVDWYKDDGITGTIPLGDRPDGKRLLNDINADQEPCLVLAYNVKRLGREARHILNAVHDLENTGRVTVRSMTEAFDTGTPAGRFFLTILAGAAGFDRETLLENMWLGANRCAAKGRWLGGIVPYGYEVIEGYLSINEEPLAGQTLSEAGVVRLIYDLYTKKGWTTYEIAEYFNTLGIPPSYVKDGRKVKKGKRKVSTAGIWRPGRIRNMLINSTYKGLHIYGQRATRKRDLIERQVPAIVSEKQWDLAQKTLKANQLDAVKNRKYEYLLRGLIKCGNCGLSYCGTSYSSGKNEKKRYYRCTGKDARRMLHEGKCTNRNVPADAAEELIWENCLKYINNPEKLKAELEQTKDKTNTNSEPLKKEIESLKMTVASKETEKQKILDLYRRQIIKFEDVEDQLVKISDEAEALKVYLRELEATMNLEAATTSEFVGIEKKLLEVQANADYERNFEEKQKIIRMMVSKIVVKEEDAQIVLQVHYKFTSAVDCTGRGSYNSVGIRIIKEEYIPTYDVDSLDLSSPQGRVKKARLDKGLKIYELAELAGLSEVTVSNFERGVSFSLPTLRAIAAVLEEPVKYLGCFEDLPENTTIQKITKLRLCNGLEKIEFANLLGINVKTLWNWEKRVTEPSDYYIELIKETFRGKTMIFPGKSTKN